MSSSVLFSLPGHTLPLTGIARPSKQWYKHEACSQLLFLLLYPNERGEIGQSGEGGFAKKGAGGSSILFCNCETKEPLIVISLTTLTSVAQVLKRTAVTLQT